jgi:hypothetical protein
MCVHSSLNLSSWCDITFDKSVYVNNVQLFSLLFKQHMLLSIWFGLLFKMNFQFKSLTSFYISLVPPHFTMLRVRPLCVHSSLNLSSWCDIQYGWSSVISKLCVCVCVCVLIITSGIVICNARWCKQCYQ